MKLHDLLEELYEKDFYLEFARKYPQSFLSAGFFVFDVDERNIKVQLDFFIPSLNKIAIVTHPFNEIKLQADEIREARQLNENLKIDIDEVVDRVLELQRKNNNTMRISKIIAILKDDIWSLTCMSSVMDILKIQVNSLTGICEKFEKANLMDYIDIRKKK